MVRLGELMMILELHRQGVSIPAIARRTGRDPNGKVLMLSSMAFACRAPRAGRRPLAQSACYLLGSAVRFMVGRHHPGSLAADVPALQLPLQPDAQRCPRTGALRMKVDAAAARGADASPFADHRGIAEQGWLD